MKLYILLPLFILISYAGLAQERVNRHQKIESAKIALITERMALSPEQAERFWPVYNEYQDKQRQLHRLNNRRAEGAIADMNETEAKEWLEKKLDLKQRELALDNEYLPRLIETTSAKQVLVLEIAEREFKRMLLQRLRSRKK